MPYAFMATTLPKQLSEFLSMVSRLHIMQTLGKTESVSTFSANSIAHMLRIIKTVC